ncbi:MATE family efflux transporter [Oryzibacter oryziterrae]|uniref:MATE family efflux transporter n=1 Tax=Oryzibacter oryziterrae TaxID=2766474 RepID=UPI001F245FE4|nr:MATE family efflux transporter [Oryzibacter oryziterrae]
MRDSRLEQDFRVDSRAVFAIALPMTLAFLTVPLIGVVDTAVVGHAGDPAMIGGVAVGALIFDVVFSTFNFLRSGTTGLTAQALGAGDRVEIDASLLRALVIALVAGLAIVLLSGPLLTAGLAFVSPSEAVASATRRYFAIRVLAAPLSLANFAFLGWLLGLGRARVGLALQILLNGTNIALAIGLGVGLDWGIEGVAWAAVCGETLAAAAGALLALRLGWAGWAVAARQVLEGSAFRRMLGVNRDIMIRSFALLGAFATFTRTGAQFGDAILAANAVLMNFFLVGGYFLDGLATAAEQLTGRALGARRAPEFHAAVRLTLIWGFAFAGVVAALFWLAGTPLIALMATAPEVRSAAAAYLPWAALTPLAGVLAFEMDGIFIGATWSADMRNMMLLSLALFVAMLFVAVPALGNHGLWLSLLVFLGARGISLSLRLPKLAARTFVKDVKNA